MSSSLSLASASAPALPLAVPRLPHVWQLQRRSTVGPRSFFLWVGTLAAASLLLAAVLARGGHTLGALFFGGHAAGLLGSAFVRALHMADREEITLSAEALVVRRYDGLSVATHRLAPLRTRVETLGSGFGRSFRLVDDRQGVAVGHWLGPARRHYAVQEITLALLALHAQAAGGPASIAKPDGNMADGASGGRPAG